MWNTHSWINIDAEQLEPRDKLASGRDFVRELSCRGYLTNVRVSALFMRLFAFSGTQNKHTDIDGRLSLIYATNCYSSHRRWASIYTFIYINVCTYHRSEPPQLQFDLGAVLYRVLMSHKSDTGQDWQPKTTSPNDLFWGPDNGLPKTALGYSIAIRSPTFPHSRTEPHLPVSQIKNLCSSFRLMIAYAKCGASDLSYVSINLS